VDDIQKWLTGGADRLDAAPAPAEPDDDAPFGDAIMLSLLNRDRVIRFLVDAGLQAREPDDLGSDVVTIDLPTGRRQIVMPGELVTRTDDEITIGRNGGVRARIPRPADTGEMPA
jgi:hypothetical protein